MHQRDHFYNPNAKSFISDSPAKISDFLLDDKELLFQAGGWKIPGCSAATFMGLILAAMGHGPHVDADDGEYKKNEE